MPIAKIAPSMLSSDFACLADEADRMIKSGADYLHMDVMTMDQSYSPTVWKTHSMAIQDGHFVPNLTLGAPIIKSLRKHTTAFLDCHLMVAEPQKWIDDFAKAGASLITFHVEATNNPSELIETIRSKGIKAGIAVKPKTPIESIYPFAHNVDQVLVMTVEPGFGGQELIPSCIDKVRVLRDKYPNLDIEVDGGIKVDNIHLLAKAGANVIVSGTGIFGTPSASDAIKSMRETVNELNQ